MSAFPYAEIERKIGYTFKNKELLKTAFIHSTYGNAHKVEDNERMEYLGDAVLELIVTEWQYKERLGAEEGVLTKERQRLVCQDALDEAVERLGIESYLLKVGGVANVGKKTVSSIFETVVAAIYLDGGYEQAKKFVLSLGLVHEVSDMKNPKGLLQEYVQSQGEELPSYEVKKEGKDNAPMFACVCKAMGKRTFGDGRTKKQAEQDAAAKMLLRLTDKPERNKKRKNKVDI